MFTAVLFGFAGPKQGAKPRYTGQQSARMGMDTLAATVRDPTALKQTMDMLNDPSTRREVEAMMRDPSFRAEMERITSSPVFKQAMAQAQDLTAELQNDPKKLQAFMKEVEGAMGSFRGEL
jgi:acetolactate synthase small subunit